MHWRAFFPSPILKQVSQNFVFYFYFFGGVSSLVPFPFQTQLKTSHPKCVYVYSFWCGGEVVS